MTETERNPELARKRILGWSLESAPILPGLDLGRDIRLTPGPNGRDLAIVEGLENLTQGLEIAFTTLLGSDIFNVQFGFDGVNAIADEQNPVLARERVRVAAIQTLRKDQRIRRIVDVKVGDVDGQLDPLAAGSRTLNVRVDFETFSGDQAAIDLTKAVING